MSGRFRCSAFDSLLVARKAGSKESEPVQPGDLGFPGVSRRKSSLAQESAHELFLNVSQAAT